MADETLIRIWAKIWTITEELSRWGMSPRWVPGVGDVQIKDYSPEMLNPLRAIFAVHGKRLEPELPEDLRNTSWVDLLDPAHVGVKDRPSFFVAKLRVQLLNRLRETAMFIVEKHRAAALIGEDFDADDPTAGSGHGGEGPSGEAAPKEWTPRKGYAGRKTICFSARFRKRGKNPSATTIDAWVKSAKNKGQTVDIEKDPANRENYYPVAWIMERIGTWNPRTSET